MNKTIREWLHYLRSPDKISTEVTGAEMADLVEDLIEVMD